MLHSRSKLALFMKKRQTTLRPGWNLSTAITLTTPCPFTGSCFSVYLPAHNTAVLLTPALAITRSYQFWKLASVMVF